MVELVLDSVQEFGYEKIVTVVGHGAEQVKKCIRKQVILYCNQNN